MTTPESLDACGKLGARDTLKIERLLPGPEGRDDDRALSGHVAKAQGRLLRPNPGVTPGDPSRQMSGRINDARTALTSRGP